MKIYEKTIINPHSHPFSLDSANSVEQFIRAAAVDFNRKAIGITDHGTLAAIIEAHDYSKKLKKEENVDITIIPGVELYILPETWDDCGFQYYHLTVHFQDFETYLEACKLSKPGFDRSIFKGGELKPLTTWDELRSLSGRITICSGCLIGVCQRPLLVNRPDISERYFKELIQIAGPKRFFAEIFPYKVDKDWDAKSKKFINIDLKQQKNPKYSAKDAKENPEYAVPKFIDIEECFPSGSLQKHANEWIFYLAKKYSIPTIISEDAHYAHEEEKIIQSCKLNKDGKFNWQMADANCMHSTEWLHNELKALHPAVVNDQKFEEMVDNSYLLFDSFKGFEPKFKHSLPSIEINGKLITEDNDLVKHTIDLVLEKSIIDLKNPVYKERLQKEIDQLAYNGKVNILPYFLTLVRIVQLAKDNGILVGPGRGSAAGSLLSYSLGITAVDPIKEDLSFERFFDVTRVEEGLADIDTDFSDKQKIIDLIKEIWGDKFAFLGTGTTFKTKSAIKDLDRLLNGEIRDETNEVSRYIPNSPQGVDEEEFLNGYVDADGNYMEGELSRNEHLTKYLSVNPKISKYLFKMVGIIRQMSRHSCGILLSDKPIQEFIPVTKVSEETTTQLLPKQVERCGGVKLDILGVNTLNDIQLCLKLVKDRHNLDLDPWKFEDCPEVWDSVIKDPITIFQLHTDTVRDGLRTMKPNSIQQAAILTSVFRPGATDATSDEDSNKKMSDIFLERWTGQREIKYIHPDLEPILRNTVGVMVFQESLMRIVHELGGLSMPETNRFRKAISKKEGDELKKLLQKVKQNLLHRNWTERQAEDLTTQMKAAGRYGFNKSHAISYVYISYACAYLKYHYPIEWWTAVLTNSSKEDLVANWQHVEKIILPPDINRSTDQFSIVDSEGKPYILAPLNMIEGVGSAVILELVNKRPFSSFEDLLEKCNKRVIHRGIVLKLILSGILDQFFEKDTPDSQKIQKYIDFRIARKEKIDPEIIADYVSITPLKSYLIKKNVFKIYNDSLTDLAIPKIISSKLGYEKDKRVFILNERYDKIICDGNLVNSIKDSKDRSSFAAVGYITESKEKTYANNSKFMLIVNAEIDGKSFEFVKWPIYGTNHHGVVDSIDGCVCVLSLYKKEGFGNNIFLDDVKILESNKIFKGE